MTLTNSSSRRSKIFRSKRCVTKMIKTWKRGRSKRSTEMKSRGIRTNSLNSRNAYQSSINSILRNHRKLPSGSSRPLDTFNTQIMRCLPLKQIKRFNQLDLACSADTNSTLSLLSLAICQNSALEVTKITKGLEFNAKLISTSWRIECRR